MNREMIDLHEEITRCELCSDILDKNRITPRPGFPPNGQYTVMVIGCEPGQNAKDRLTPDEYRQRFLDDSFPNNRNTVRRLFNAFRKKEIVQNNFFYTNAVKCPATPDQAPECYKKCQSFLHKQIRAIKPLVIVVFGRAAERIRFPKARKNEIIKRTFQGHPCIISTHPQGASNKYLLKVAERVKRYL